MARILIIEDNPTNLQLMSYLLRAFGHEVLTASRGEDGIETVRREAPDLVVCDVQLPGIDGLEVARRLAQHPASRRIPLVAVTALAMVGDRDRVMAAGFDSYIAKPIEPQLFVKEIESFLSAGQPEASPESRPETTSPPRAAAHGKRLRVLVVDNSAVNLELMRSTLEPLGYLLVCASGGEEALAWLAGEVPDLIISDLHMPRMDGFDFIQRIKADPVLREVPFVFLSSTVWTGRDDERGLTLGADDFIRRPIEPRDLLARLEACLTAAKKR